MRGNTGPSTTLRSGRDDKLVRVLGCWCPDQFASRPERSVVEAPAVTLHRLAGRSSSVGFLLYRLAAGDVKPDRRMLSLL